MNDIDKMVNGGGSPQLDAEVEQELAAALEGQSVEQLMEQAAGATHAVEAEAGAEAGAEPKDAPAPHFDAELKRGRILRIDRDDVFVELAGLDGRLQAVVPLRQFDRPPRPGSIMEFVVDRIDEQEGLIHLSREGAISAATWEHLTKGAVVEARVTGANKGGLELEMVGGIRAFMPASQVDWGHVEDLQPFVGQKLHALVHDVDRRARKVIISRRRFLEHEKERNRLRTWATLAEGQSVSGKVTSLMPYGAFVDLGGVDGLLHITDMSYARIRKPEEVVKVGDEVQVVVLKLDQEKKRVRLGLKQTQADPWEAVEGTIHQGAQVSGTVQRIADFGAFVEIMPGVEGLLPASEVSWRRNARVADEVQVGQALRLAVIALDLENRRVTLSLKQAQGDPWMGAEHKFASGSIVEGKVKSTTDFGAFVELEPGVEGLVHISALSHQRVAAVEDVVKVGEVRQFRVLDVDEEKHKISLSIKALDESAPAAEERPERSANPRGARTGGFGGGGRGGNFGGGGGGKASPLKLPKSLMGPTRKLKGGIE